MRRNAAFRLSSSLCCLSALPVLIAWFFALVTVTMTTTTTAYKFGDFVELDLVIDSVKVDAYRHQMPRFGVVHHRTVVDGVTKQLGLQFDDGLFVLPVYPIDSRAGSLVRLDVEMISDESSLQNVIGTPTYAKVVDPPPPTNHREIVVTYIWTMQPNGNEHTLSVVYTLTVLACLAVVLFSSGVFSDNGNDGHGYGDSGTSSSSNETTASSHQSSGAPKWD
jgi:hypothetical protein